MDSLERIRVSEWQAPLASPADAQKLLAAAFPGIEFEAIQEILALVSGPERRIFSAYSPSLRQAAWVMSDGKLLAIITIADIDEEPAEDAYHAYIQREETQFNAATVAKVIEDLRHAKRVQH